MSPQLRLLAIVVTVVFGICFGMLATGDYITQKIGPKNRKKKTTDLKGEDSATFLGKLICRI